MKKVIHVYKGIKIKIKVKLIAKYKYYTPIRGWYCCKYYLNLFFIYFYKNEFRVKSIYRMMQKEAVRDKSGSSVPIDFLRLDNEYFLIKTEIHTH